jgi:hypothetical protein
MKSKSVRLTPAMEKLVNENSGEFERECGHGYVHSIGNGADLYLLLHFHNLETKDRLDLSYEAHASASMADVFSSSGSTKLQATIEKYSKNQQLDISFVQEGGKIEALPTDLEEAKAQVKKLAEEEFSNPRRTFITVFPYSSLPNYPPAYLIETSDSRQRAVRYIERLNSLIFEARNVRENLYRDRSDTTIPDDYYYYYRHQLRAERPSDVADAASKLADITSDALKQLNAPPCSKQPLVLGAMPPGLSAVDQKAFASKRDLQLSTLKDDHDKCKAIADKLKADTNNLEDLSLWAQLPVPVNSLTKDTMDKLDDVSGDLTARKNLYAQSVFRHWVERQDQVRCRLFRECLSSDEMDSLYNGILSSLTGLNVAGTQPSAVLTLCMAEEDNDCTDQAVGMGIHIDKNYGCDWLSKDQEMGDAACKDRGQFSAGTRLIKDEKGYKHCGREILNVGCYSYIQQPTFPHGP